MPHAASSQQAGGSTTALMFAVNFVVNMSISFDAPFLPMYLAERELLPEGQWAGLVQGMLFSFGSMVQLVVTPMCPMVMQRFGRFASAASGILLFAASMITFGPSAEIVAFLTASSTEAPSKHPACELALMFLARFLGACGGTLASISTMSLALEASPGNRGVLMGASETAIGVGFAVGPSVGAAFFLAGGFPAPFLACAGVSIGLFPLLFIARGDVVEGAQADEAEEAHASAQSSLKTPVSPWRSPAALVMSVVCGGCLVIVGFLDPTLAPFEGQILGATTAGAGALFSASAFPYAVLGIVVGAFVDSRPDMGIPLMCGGGALLGAVFMSIPPVALFMATWTWQTIMLLLTGLAAACGMVPAVPVVSRILHEEAAATGRPMISDDEVLSFAWSFMTLGEMLGPLVGGSLTQSFGFPLAARSVGLSLMALSVLSLVTLAKTRHLNVKEMPRLETPLLPGTPSAARLPHGSDMPRSLGVVKQCSRKSSSKGPKIADLVIIRYEV